MEQRTCNIIMCCKGHCKLAGENAPPLEAIAAYMSAECACPKEDYTGKLMETILREDSAQKPLSRKRKIEQVKE